MSTSTQQSVLVERDHHRMPITAAVSALRNTIGLTIKLVTFVYRQFERYQAEKQQKALRN